MAVHYRVLDPAQHGIIDAATRCAKGGCKLDGGRRMPGAGSSRRSTRKAPLGKPAVRPYWGKLAVRMIAGIEETSASFEARTAPRSYPTLVSAVTAMVLAVPPVTHPQENPTTKVAITPRAIPCSRRVRDSPCGIDGISMTFAFPCEEGRHKPRRWIFISNNPKDHLSKSAHFRLSMGSVPEIDLVHLTRNDRLPTPYFQNDPKIRTQPPYRS